MKIYKLDIDTSKPTRQVVAMQQNSTGMLSVDVANDGKYIRNLSCSLYEGDNEISATADNGYKIEMGDTTKLVKLTAKSTPVECSAEYVAKTGSSGVLKQVFCSKVQLDTGTYHQDEFYGIATKFGSGNGMVTMLYVNGTDLSNVNFTQMALTPWNADTPVWFYTDEGLMSKDELIIATGSVSIGRNEGKKTNGVLSSYTYPSVGYYTDYQLDTVIKPTTNAACYAEYDIAEPTPEEPDEEPPAETDGE